MPYQVISEFLICCDAIQQVSSLSHTVLAQRSSKAACRRPLSRAPQQINSESQHLLNDIIRLVKEGGTVNETWRVIDACRAHYKSQPGNQYTTIRVSCILLQNLVEAQRKVTTQAEQLAEVRNRLTSDLVAVQLKYDNLERASRGEKETALAIEKGLREHYDLMNSFWKEWLESVNRECRSLRKELDRYRSSGRMTQAPHLAPRPQYFFTSGAERSSSHKKTGQVNDDDDDDDVVIDIDPPDSPPLSEILASLVLAPASPSIKPFAYANNSRSGEPAAEIQVTSPTQGDPEPESELEVPGTTSTMAHPLSPDYPRAPGPEPDSQLEVPGTRPMMARPWGSFPVHLPSRSRTSRDIYAHEHFVSKLHDLLDSPRPPSSLHGHMQLEKERLERRRLRETPKDATNVPGDTSHSHLSRHKSKGS